MDIPVLLHLVVCRPAETERQMLGITVLCIHTCIYAHIYYILSKATYIGLDCVLAIYAFFRNQTGNFGIASLFYCLRLRNAHRRDNSPKNGNMILIHPHVILNLFAFLLWNTKDILKNVNNQTVLDPTDFHSIFCTYDGRQWDPKPTE